MFVLTAAVLALCWASPAALGAAGEWWQSDHARVRLISASDAVGTAQRLTLGLEFQLIPRWKIYWRSPGDAGFPPRPNWAGSENLAKATLRWPVPKRFSVLGLETLGYEGAVVLPVEVLPFEPGQPLHLRASVPFLACDDICVPYEAQVELDLPRGPETTTREAALIQRFAERVPKAGPSESLAVAEAFVDGPPGDQVIRLSIRAEDAHARQDVLVEGPDGFRFGTARTATGGAAGDVLVKVTPPPGRLGSDADLVGKRLTLTLIQGENAIEQQITASRGRPFPPRALEPLSWAAFLSALALAFAGGLVLNLMPCVLPVLSLKLLSIMGHGGKSAADVRRGFLVSAAGIITSFLVLGTIAVALKMAGLAAGWGIQFQQPLFLAAMALLLALFAANLWGLFEIRLPAPISDAVATAGMGNGLLAHFATGAFATLLATPCSAPFLGTAVGFALARGPGEIYAVFAVLGLGLASPYLLVAAVPAVATRMPRPGPWMVVVRRILGIALLATAGWLLTVLDAQAGRTAAFSVGGALSLVLAALAVRRLWPRMPAALLVSVAAGFSLVALAAPLTIPPAAVHQAAEPHETIRWVAFDPDAIPGHVADGRVVFVDVTADWCITCQVNKILVLEKEPIRDRLNRQPIIAMRADWTRPDPTIAAFLRRYGRFGIPFNVVFGPGSPGGLVLPELLTSAAVSGALDVASGIPKTARR